MSFRVDLDIFRGPLDLLLYLVRKHEVEVVDIPIAEITTQFLDYLAVLEQLDVNAVGDFLEVASTLIEIKSRLVLPHGDEVEEELDHARHDLVERLLEYKRFKDAASILEERARGWQERFPRLSNDLPARERDPAVAPIRELELWDLVSAFGRVMRERQAGAGSTIVFDDTPIQVYMQRIHAELRERPRVAFSELFQAGMHKSTLIGMFLAVLELVRHHGIRAVQDEPHGELWILPGPQSDQPIEALPVDNYEG
ncbi:MAG TPA: segregation/condensation protein A [Pirellulales bacterium]|jgi:segregation and condensation protein A|nr:segregation/condensation protein A [Pirellulales bacterium]